MQAIVFVVVTAMVVWMLVVLAVQVGRDRLPVSTGWVGGLLFLALWGIFAAIVFGIVRFYR